MVQTVTGTAIRTGTAVALDRPAIDGLSKAVKIWCFRFVPAGLNNVWRHAEGLGQQVQVTVQADLSRREEDILRLVATGLSKKEVGRKLDIQEKTVKHYMTSILQKLHVRNRVEAAMLARAHLKG